MSIHLQPPQHGCESGGRALVIVLAGGQGQRLVPLTNNMAKPAARFGGAYRMIDFTLSSCVNSGFRRIYLLTQFASSSLNRHVRKGWAPLLNDDLDEFVDLIPPQKLFADRWYAGTADAVFQNLFLLQQERPQNVILLSGDHAYKMDYSLMLQQHQTTDADLTIACLALPAEQCTQLGVVTAAADGRIEQFVEKPASPSPMPDNPDMALVSMAVYIWRTEALVRHLIADARRDTSHDFGKDLIPAMVAAGEEVYAYRFKSAGRGTDDYWRDIGTLSSYWQAHADLVSPEPKLDLYDPTWPIYTYRPVVAPAKITCSADGSGGYVADSIISAGCLITDAAVRQSVLSPGVSIRDACVEQSVLMDDVTVAPGAHLCKAIVAEGVTIPAGMSIGDDRERDARRFVVTDDGITVVPSRIVLDEQESYAKVVSHESNACLSRS